MSTLYIFAICPTNKSIESYYNLSNLKLFQMKKYMIKSLLEELPKKEYDLAMKSIPTQLGISSKTFRRWLKIPLKSKSKIPGEYMLALADFFGVGVKELYLQEPMIIKLQKNKPSIADELGLSQ